MVIATLIPAIGQFFGFGSITSLVILGIMILVLVAYFTADYFEDKFREIDKVSKRIRTLEEKLDYMKGINDLDKRLSLLERRMKGNTDPRTIALIILLFLLLLYLRSIGVL